MKEYKKQAKGITLIALVVTIIVLLILAGVTISSIIVNNGIFSKAEQAKDEYRDASAKEEASLNKLADSMMGNETEEDNPPIVKDETPPVIHELKWDRTAGVLSVNAEDLQSGIDEYLYFIDNSDTPNVKKEANLAIPISNGMNGGNYQNPYIPKGFWHKEGDVESGYVIADAPNVKVQVKDKEGNIAEAILQGNEFVWVPV